LASKGLEHRILWQERLQQHRLERYMTSNDLDFENKATDIIGQALDRLDPVLLLSPGRAERHGFEYYLQACNAVLICGPGCEDRQDPGEDSETPPSSEFISFLSELVSRARWAKEIHIVLDNLSAHKTKAVQEFLAEHPKVRFHFTPTYSSRLNQVELWFAKIQRDLLAPRNLHLCNQFIPQNRQVHSRLR